MLCAVSASSIIKSRRLDGSSNNAARDTFICPDCDSKRRPSLVEGHTFAHPLVRIRDSSIGGENASIEDKLLSLEQRFQSLEFKVTEGLTSMESKVEERLSALETKVDQRLALLETNMETRFSALETVLRQIAAQTAALPAVYGQVVRDYSRNSPIIREPLTAPTPHRSTHSA